MQMLCPNFKSAPFINGAAPNFNLKLSRPFKNGANLKLVQMEERFMNHRMLLRITPKQFETTLWISDKHQKLPQNNCQESLIHESLRIAKNHW